MNTPKNCNRCEQILDEHTWYPANIKKSNYICNTCDTIKRRTNRLKKTARDIGDVAKRNYSGIKKGYVYIVSNPAWERWFKVGMALDAYDRCAGYQTSSPFRDYVVEYCKFFTDRKEAEKLVHAELRTQGVKHSSEWFNTSLNKIKTIIKELQDET
jgi:uncharacterized protein YutD